MSHLNSVQDEAAYQKRMWDESNTKWLIEEFKTFYALWRNGSISKKNQMWQKISQALNSRGLDCSAGQAENRFKTLQRSYRKACGIYPAGRPSRKSHPYSEELSSIFVESLPLLANGSVENDADNIMFQDSNDNEDDDVQQFLDESTGSIFRVAPQLISMPRQRPLQDDIKSIFSFIAADQVQEESNESIIDDESSDVPDYSKSSHKKPKILTRSSSRRSGNLGVRIDNIINSNEQILNKTKETSSKKESKLQSRIKFNVPRRKPISVAKSNIDVLSEIKELLKKIEIRRQVRHEQNIKIAKERNAILRRKNEILESMLAQNDI